MLNKANRYSFLSGAPKHVIANRYFVLRYRVSDEPPARFAFIVSKRIDSRAVVRNKIKRMYADALGSLLSTHQFQADCVFYVRKPSIEVSQDTLAEEIEKILRKEGIIRS